MTKKTKEVINIEEILSDLSYSWATPEAQDFSDKIKKEKYSSARKLLAEQGLSREHIKVVMDYYKEKYTSKKKLVEYFSFEYENLTEEDSVLVSFGGTLFSTKVSHDSKRTDSKEICFFDKQAYEYVPLSQATQVWKIEIVK